MLYDCLIIGAGPAGLSAAVYMGRFLRKTLVIDCEEGRSSFEQKIDNYLGFPQGVKVNQLRTLGIAQAKRFGAEFVLTEVESIAATESGNKFRVTTEEGIYTGRSVILCTGVSDIWPNIPDVLKYVGRGLHWCIACDGYQAYKKKVLLFGRSEEAAARALQFIAFTNEITFLTSPGRLDCSVEKVEELEAHGIRMIEGTPDHVDGDPDNVKAIVLKDGRVIPTNIMFSLLGCVPKNTMAHDLGVKCNSEGYVIVEQDSTTSVKGVYAAGDVTNRHSHQVVSAAHEGAEAAQACNYYLFSGLFE